MPQGGRHHADEGPFLVERDRDDKQTLITLGLRELHHGVRLTGVWRISVGSTGPFDCLAGNAAAIIAVLSWRRARRSRLGRTIGDQEPADLLSLDQLLAARNTDSWFGSVSANR